MTETNFLNRREDKELKLFHSAWRECEKISYNREKVRTIVMPQWDQHSIRAHIHVYSSDDKDLGHVAQVYEDSFKIEKGLLFFTDRYIPYSAIASVDNDRVRLVMSADEVIKNDEWKVRPNYEDHLSDPTQLIYDRGHGVHDPFDENNPDLPWEGHTPVLERKALQDGTLSEWEQPEEDKVRTWFYLG